MKVTGCICCFRRESELVAANFPRGLKHEYAEFKVLNVHEDDCEPGHVWVRGVDTISFQVPRVSLGGQV